MFPRSTGSQMLRAYLSRFIEADGHAHNFANLDAVEIFCEQSSINNVAASTHSDYKSHCTIKFLNECDNIGCTWDGMIPDGNPGKAADTFMTGDTKILRQIPFGCTAKVDKGFLVDNKDAVEGIVIDCPQKRLKKQVQQSSADTGQTQKVGNTRIVIENVNGKVKGSVRLLNALIPPLAAMKSLSSVTLHKCGSRFPGSCTPLMEDDLAADR